MGRRGRGKGAKQTVVAAGATQEKKEAKTDDGFVFKVPATPRRGGPSMPLMPPPNAVPTAKGRKTTKSEPSEDELYLSLYQYKLTSLVVDDKLRILNSACLHDLVAARKVFLESKVEASKEKMQNAKKFCRDPLRRKLIFEEEEARQRIRARELRRTDKELADLADALSEKDEVVRNKRLASFQTAYYWRPHDLQ